MVTIKLNSASLRCALVVACAALVLAACSHGSLSSGAKYQAEGKYRSAYIEAKKVLQKKPNSGDAWLLLGKATLMMGNPKDALTDLEKAQSFKVPAERWAVPMGRAWLVTHQYDNILKKLPDGKGFKPQTQAALDVVRGDAFRGSNDPTKARAAYEAALKLDPKNARALVGLSTLAAAGGDMAGARKYVQQAMAGAPESQDAWVAQGNLAFSDGKFDDAGKDYQKALDLKTLGWLPQDRFVAQLKLADVQARQKQYDKALTNLKALEKMAPGMPQPYYLHALVLFQQGHLDEAITQLQQVLKIDPDNVAAQFLMGQVNYAKGDYGQAQMYLSNVMGMDPKNAQARKLLALSFYREGSSSRALTTLKPVLPGQPTNTEMLAMMQRAVARGAAMPHPKSGAAATRAGALPAAASSAGSALSRQFAGARQALQAGNATKAVALLKAMPAGNGEAAQERTGLLVMAYVRDQKSGEAVKVAKAWAAAHAKDAAAHLLYGTALVADGKQGQARAEYEQATKLDPGSASAMLNLGSLDVLQGHLKDAQTQFEAILKHDPQNVAAMLALGKLAQAQNDHAGAIKWFKQAIAAAPQSPEAYLRLIMVYSSGGRFDEAVDIANKLVAANPGEPLGLNALGAAELNAGHADKALKPLEQAVKRAPKVALYRINLARAQILLKDTKSARANLEAAVKSNPDDAQAVGMLAFMKFHAGDTRGALALARTLQKTTATKVPGYTLEGDLYMAGKDYNKAASAYQQGLKVSYTRSLVLKQFQALSAAGSNNPEQGLREWLSKHAKDASIRMVLAQYYMDNSRQQEAARQYRDVLNAYPSNVIALNNLAWLYTTQHNPEAVALAAKAHKLAPDSPSVADTYAFALLSANQAQTALPILQQAAAQAPNTPTLHYHLALAQSRTGDNAAALATLAALEKSGAKYPESAQAAALYKKLGGGAAGK